MASIWASVARSSRSADRFISSWLCARAAAVPDDNRHRTTAPSPRILLAMCLSYAYRDTGYAPFPAVVMRDPLRYSRRDGDEAFGELKRIAQRGVHVHFYSDSSKFAHGTRMSSAAACHSADCCRELSTVRCGVPDGNRSQLPTNFNGIWRSDRGAA